MSHVHDALRRASLYPDQTSASPFELNPLLAALFRRKGLFLATFFGFFLFAAIIVLLMPKKYEAEMKLLVKNERQDLVISPESNSNTLRPAEPSETDINSEIEMLRSRDVLRKVAFKTGLSKPELGTVQAAGEVSPISLDKALIRLEHDISITAVKKSNIIDITYLSKDPQIASAVLRNLADSYLEAHLKVHGTPGSFTFFDDQAKAYKERLTQSENQLEAFAEQNSSLVQPDQDQALTTHSMDSAASLEEADAQIADYQHRIQKSENLLTTLEARVTTQERTVPQAQLIGNLNQTLTDLRNKRTELATKFRSDDRTVVEVDKQMQDTTAALNDALKQSSTEKQTDVNPIRQEVEKEMAANQSALAGLKARRASLAGTVSGYKQKMVDLVGATVQHDQLVRQVKENEQNYLLYSKKREEARIAESLDKERITNVAVVQAPVTPVQASSPKTALDLVLSLICAAFVASIVVISLELLSTKPASEGRHRDLATAR